MSLSTSSGEYRTHSDLPAYLLRLGLHMCTTMPRLISMYKKTGATNAAFSPSVCSSWRPSSQAESQVKDHQVKGAHMATQLTSCVGRGWYYTLESHCQSPKGRGWVVLWPLISTFASHFSGLHLILLAHLRKQDSAQPPLAGSRVLWTQHRMALDGHIASKANFDR